MMIIILFCCLLFIGDNSDESSNHHESSNQHESSNGASISTNAQVPVQETCDDHGGSTTLTSIPSNQGQ